MSKIKLNVLGKCPYCGAPNTKKINETEYLCNHCGQTSFIEKELKAYKKLSDVTGISNELTTRLKKQIISVDGEKDILKISEFVDNRFLALDTKEFRKYVTSIMPDINFEQEYESQIGELHTVTIPIGVRFFWPDA